MEIDNLGDEWEKQSEMCQGTKNVATSVSIIVRDPSKPPPKTKLVARGGKLEIDLEEVGKDVKTVKEDTSSPYFRVVKLIGDKRAVVAERGFNRPYSKVKITNCGLME
ncbi:hypothetical protein K7X08_024085 [Anisodus acutangulus]|uniref:Uncharacterized protein n=1 Tax=Anisodus acutangulus TaxID=402998 RepID=A0A9Q1M9B6_9SOLA|nr:hypothetical protein K7X08_024085 [Anisodus acutangulus]